MASFFDELEKISATLQQISSNETTSSVKPGEVKSPVSPVRLKDKPIDPSQRRIGLTTNYTRSNVEAPGADVTLTQGQKAAPPPPITS